MKEGVSEEFFKDKHKWTAFLKQLYGVKNTSELTADMLERPLLPHQTNPHCFRSVYQFTRKKIDSEREPQTPDRIEETEKLDEVQWSEVKVPRLKQQVTPEEYNRQSQEVIYLKRLSDEGTRVLLSAELKERLTLASLKDQLFDQKSQEVVRSVYKGERKPTLEQICPEQTLRNRRSQWQKKLKLRYKTQSGSVEETPESKLFINGAAFRKP